MEIFRLSIEDIEIYKSDIIKMLGQSFIMSFPEKEINVDTLFTRVESLKNYISEEKAIVYGSKIKSVLVGFIWFFEKDENEQKIIHINYFVVQENYRYLGVGKTLWNEVENYAKKEMVNEIELLVTKGNKDAVNFYLKREFEVERFVMKKRL